MDILKKSVYAAVGFAVMTRDKVGEAAQKLAKDAKMSEEEGRKFVDELMSRSDETRKNIEQYVGEKVEAALKKMKIPARKEFDELEKRLSKLENGQGCGK
ncbi:MAG: phasin family protein [Chitinispirillales bacterium]|jgi:polyhydroxyalkanoate synthesis regulator phasin|nr:phasin family protein [Chitinispirillales bacterium]